MAAFDLQSPYVPLDVHPPPANLTIGRILTGTGAPAATRGKNGDFYVDLSTGDYYVRSGDAWVLSTGGGSPEVHRYDGNPNGNVTATGPAVVIGTGASLGSLWTKDTAGTSNNEWTQIIV